MSGLETLPPDQRAVLRLILAQGRDYAELAQLLKIDAAAVRTRAHAGLDALATAGDTPDDAARAQIADYLLGQQDDGERLVTLAELGESAAACRWAAALRAQLLPLARQPLPEVPEAAPTNGTVAAVTGAAPISPPAPVGPQKPASGAPRPSRLGGAILLAAAAAAAIVLAIVVIGGGSGNDGKASTSAATTTTPAQTSTTGSQAQIVGQVNLLATPAGGQATGLGFVEQASGQTAIAIQAQKLPGNGSGDIYAAWLSGAAGTKLLGFVPHQVKTNGSFTVSAAFPQDYRRYDTVLITREAAAGGKVPAQPGEAIMRGTLVYRH